MLQTPNFLVIGAAKSGTTSLYHYLKQHPQIYMSPKKELNFFVFDGEDVDTDSLVNEGGKKRYNWLKSLSITSFQDYQAQFEGVIDEKAIGEASPTYLYHPSSAQRIHQYNPEMKLIAVFRNPVTRASSHFAQYLANNQEPQPDFAQAIKMEDIKVHSIWWDYRHYIRMGFYYSQIRRYLELFGQSQIRIYLYEDFCNNPLKMLEDIYSFLEVDNSFIANTSVRYWEAKQPKNKVVHSLFTSRNPLKKAVKNILPSRVQQVVTNLKNRNLVKIQVPLSTEARNYLTSIYREDILNLQNLIGRDLSLWLN